MPFYDTNIQDRTGLPLFFYIMREIVRQVTKQTSPVRLRTNNLFFTGEESHKEEDMPIKRRAFDVQFKLYFST